MAAQVWPEFFMSPKNLLSTKPGMEITINCNNCFAKRRRRLRFDNRFANRLMSYNESPVLSIGFGFGFLVVYLSMASVQLMS